MIARSVRRRGFTLIELVIVIGLVLILATLAAAFLPNLDRNKGVPNAVAQLSGWINLSKAQALRDHRPHGIRFLIDPNDPTGTRCTTVQYIEQPEPVAPRGAGIRIQLSSAVPGSNPPVMGNFTWVTLFQGNSQIPWEGVDALDYLELSGGPSGFAKIDQVTTTIPAGVQRSTLYLDRVIDGVGTTPISMTTGFRVIRAPRPLVGEPTYQLHRDVYIDLTQCFPCPVLLPDPTTGQPVLQGAPPYGNNYTGFQSGAWGPANTGVGPNNNIDLLFNASGFVASAPTGHLILAVRHVDRPTDMLFVAVYTRTGKITSHTYVDIHNLDPYGSVKDGKGSGL
jgi:prepilin-type N-terminal cleavage/methylation domain-containing protein